MLEHAREMGGRPIVLVVVDDRGEPICSAAMAGVNAALARQNAFKKAYTSATTRGSTMAFAERLRKSGQTLHDFGNPNFFAGGGGDVVVAPDGTILGGLGVSGRTAEEDEAIVRVGAQAIHALLA
jgi:uncharacterized protein GlcG (DUF336 family)